MSVRIDLQRQAQFAFERYSNAAAALRQLEQDYGRCGGLTIGGEPAYKVLAQRLERARIDKANAYAAWQAAKAAAPTGRPVKLHKRGPVALPRPAPRPQPPSAAQQRQAAALRDAAAWRLSGLK